MEYQIFLMETFFHFVNKFHYYFVIMENESNEILMENQKKCSNSIKKHDVIYISIQSNRF